MEAVGPHFHEVGVDALGLEGRGPTDLRSVFLHVDALDIRDKLHEVPGSGVEEVSAHDGFHAIDIDHFQFYGPFAVFLFEDFGGVGTVGGQEMPHAGGGFQAQVIGEGDDASASVSAHHAAASVGVEELHGEVVSRGLAQDHEAVGAVFPAKGQDAAGLTEGVHVGVASVQHHEVVAGSRELVQGRDGRDE